MSILPVSEIDGFFGELIRPNDPGYGDARRTRNSMVDRRPSLIARCRTTSDVVAALRYAHRYDAAHARSVARVFFDLLQNAPPELCGPTERFSLEREHQTPWRRCQMSTSDE